VLCDAHTKLLLVLTLESIWSVFSQVLKLVRIELINADVPDSQTMRQRYSVSEMCPAK